jgi:hypothetical protein
VEVEITNVESTVRAVDGESLVTPRAMDRIVRSVLAAVKDQDAHRKRVRAEQRITAGVSHELEEEGD